tara:strand:+ start:128 stop:475 length:348 start_codon:yes stop_codon:yes gene_type:complete|eukprot:SAG11_NODE_318_length_10823_cov_79.807068_4_plen_116_part_00
MKKFIPTEKDKKTVIDMTGKGFKTEEIATCIFKENGKPITGMTLRNVFKQEIALGKIQTDERVASVMQEMALSGDNTKATMFWLESRRKWNKENNVELAGEIKVLLPSNIKVKDA